MGRHDKKKPDGRDRAKPCMHARTYGSLSFVSCPSVSVAWSLVGETVRGRCVWISTVLTCTGLPLPPTPGQCTSMYVHVRRLQPGRQAGAAQDVPFLPPWSQECLRRSILASTGRHTEQQALRYPAGSSSALPPRKRKETKHIVRTRGSKFLAIVCPNSGAN